MATVTVGISYTSTERSNINFHDPSIFSWTVTEVLASGTFVDGNPWVVVGSGAQLVDIVPKSVQQTSGHTHSYYPNIVNVWISGSAKNPNTFHRTNKNDPTGLLGISAPAGTTGSKKIVFDQRAIINVGEGTQAFLDAQYDVNSNIGIPNQSGNTVPIGLTGGDVIVTADSVWYNGLSSNPLFTNYGVVSSSVVNAPKHWTTGIKRFGVLTVLKEAPTEPCFRPPLQWISEEPQTRPTPIPLSAAISLTAIDAILGQTFSTNQNAALYNGSSPIFHDGHDTYFSSSNGVHGIRARSTATTTNETYFGTASLFLANLLFDMTRTSGTVVTDSNRTICRNRIIQYAIDAYGSVMMLSKTNSTAGQRPAEIKPWLMLGGFLLGGASSNFGGDLINFYDRLITKYAGTDLANLSYTDICKLLFNDDLCCVPVISGPTLGGPNSAISQIWGPGLTHSVVNATQGTTAWVADSYYVVENGNFANLKVTGFKNDISTAHIAKHLNYYNSFVKVVNGSGASETIYRVLSVNTDGGGPLLPKDEVRLDRPWSNGFPDSTSTIKLFPFRNGAIENTSSIDLGRYVYAVNGTDPTYIYYNNNSPIALGYGQICFKAYLPYYSALKALRDKTGDSSYVLGETWKWLADVIDGSGLSVIDYATRYGNCPDSDRWNLIWDDVTSIETNSSGATYASNYFGFPSHNYNTIKGWLRNAVGSDGEYGERHLNRILGLNTTTSNPDPDTTPIDNHPISVRLTTTDMNGMNNAVDWMFKDSTINASHGVDGIYLPEDITKIPNILANIPEMTDPVRDNEGIGGSRSNEINGELGGGVFVNGGVADFTLNPLVGSVNTLDIRNIATLFMQKARVLGGVTMNLILHGKIIPSPALAEYKYVAAPPPASPEFPESNENIEGVHFDEFYRKYAYIAFNSREVPVQSITSNQISFRKGFHHGFTKWSKADLAGLSLSNGATGVSQIHAMNLSLWNTPHGLSFGALCTFDALTTPVNETASAINATNVPTTISCTKKTLRFVGIQNLTAHFQAVSNKEFSLFSTLTFNHNGKIIASDPLFGLDDPNPVYTLTNKSSLSIRTQYAHTQGNKNLLGIKFASGATRLFDGISNIGIVVGSYVRISGSSATSNNGIYQVLSIQNGIPNDINENTSLADGLSPFSYLELSRAITPTAEGDSILIENVSHLPILHLRYRTS
jgi:hypothetical protein